MKKIIQLALCLLMVFSIAACSNKSEGEQGGKENPYADLKIAMVSDTVGTDQFILQAKNKLEEIHYYL